QAFGLIVTAEPYSSVRTPSDVVVLQNEPRPDTIGKVQPVVVSYDLMPRGHYTYQKPEGDIEPTPMVSMDRYETLLGLYEAQNAVAIAGANGAAQYAPNPFAKAQEALNEARRLETMRADRSLIIQSARAAVQTAEDARAIAEKRREQDRIVQAERNASRAEEARAQAEATAIRAEAEAAAARRDADAERAARRQAEYDAAAAARSQVSQADRVQVVTVQPAPNPNEPKLQLRMRLLEQLNGVMITRDTPRGL